MVRERLLFLGVDCDGGRDSQTAVNPRNSSFQVLAPFRGGLKAGEKLFSPTWSRPTVQNRTGQAPPG